MSYNWIFKSLTSKSINAGEAGFASVQPNYPNIFEWTTDNQVTFDTVAEGPLIITFNRPVIISKYRLLSRRGLRYMKGWNISISYDGTSFMTIDTKNEDLCKISTSEYGLIDCGELTDRIFPVPKMTIAKIKLSLTVPNKLILMHLMFMERQPLTNNAHVNNSESLFSILLSLLPLLNHNAILFV